MARTLYLRPTADVSLQHSCSSGSSGYAMIDEETSDGASTYIQHSLSTSNATKTSKFKLSAAIPNIKHGVVTSAQLVVVVYRPSVVASITLSGTAQIDSLTSNSLTFTKDEWTTNTFDIDTSIFTFGATNTKTLTLTTTGYVSKNSCEVRITQAYIVITYDATYTFSSQHFGHGGSCSAPSSVSLDASGTFTITLDTDKHVLRLLDNGTEVSPTTSSTTTATYTVSSADDDHVLTIYYELLYYKINGAWVEQSKLYKKVNGKWKQVADYDAVLSQITTPLIRKNI